MEYHIQHTQTTLLAYQNAKWYLILLLVAVYVNQGKSFMVCLKLDANPSIILSDGNLAMKKKKTTYKK